MNPITVQRRRECFEELTAAQKAISDASATLGEGNQHIRESMLVAQRALAMAVVRLWKLEVKP